MKRPKREDFNYGKDVEDSVYLSDRYIIELETYADKLEKQLLLCGVSNRRELLLAVICEYNKFNTQAKINEVEEWLEKWDSK